MKYEELEIAKQQIDLQKNQSTDEYGNYTVRGYADMVEMDLEYDNAGNISNGQDIYNAIIDKYNEAVDEYNANKDADDTSEYEEEIDK